ncbi:restriction endonuclease subunit S, partial [Vibrio parahaemolyticus]|uniref:restriction endonuclease subunit S n=1 Tax=Vibrio parahaemolyticus TaxID=670 RepID=UPI0015DE5BE5
ECGLQNRDLTKITQEGARNHGLLNISVEEFFADVNVMVPELSEQKKIAKFLTLLNEKIELVSR